MVIPATSLKAGFYGGVVIAVVLGVYLLQLWQPDRQVELHSVHLMHALEQKNWGSVAEFIDPAYQDQWGDDRSLVLARLRAVLSYTRSLRLQARDTVAFASGDAGEWRAMVCASGEENEVVALIKERINNLPEPFRLQWRRHSWKPWDWTLTRVTNPALTLPEDAGL